MAKPAVPLYPAGAMSTNISEPVLLVYCSCPDADSAQRIADLLVAERLAACANIVPGLLSTYRWKDEVQHDAECLLLIKTRESRFEALRESIRSHHPYELPEIIAVPVVAGLDAYLGWVRDNT
jgi:periplasmic divalent cation tolerance protein